MELLALAFVNLLTLCIMYFFFSLKTSKAIRKIHKDPLSSELKENIELAVQYINSSINLFDQKKKSCYQMLRTAEEILSNIQKNIEENPKKESLQNTIEKKKENTKKKKTLKKKSVNTTTQDIKGKKTVYYNLDPDQSKFETSIAEHALERLGNDKAEITPISPNAEKAFILGASQGVSANISNDKNSDNNSNLQSAWEYTRSWLEKNLLKSQLAKEIEKLNSSWHANSKKLPDEPHTSHSKASQNSPEVLVPQKASLPTEATEQFVYQNAPPTQKASLPAEAIEPILSFPQTFKIPESILERTQYARSLLQQGLTKAEISNLSGLSLAEIHLLSSLPPSDSKKQRRKRLQNAPNI